MRDHYDFSNGIRGKYAGKVDTTNVRILDPAKPVDLGEIRHKRGDILVGTLRKTYGQGFAPGVRSDTRLDITQARRW
jgi:hypothetical protein